MHLVKGEISELVTLATFMWLPPPWATFACNICTMCFKLFIFIFIYFSDDGEPRAKKRKDTTMSEKIIDNFRVHLGADTYVQDIEEAIKKVANRDYSCLDLDKIPPIFVPCLFLPTNCPEVIDYEKFISEMEELKKNTDIETAKALKEKQKDTNFT